MSELDQELERAAADGIISAEQAQAIRARRTGEADHSVNHDLDPGEEPFRLIGNFGDVFLCLGIVIVYWSLGAFLRIAGIDPLWSLVGFALLFWCLAEFFVFGAKRKLPAILSILFFVLMAYRAAMLWTGAGDFDDALRVLSIGDRARVSQIAVTHFGVLTAAFAVALARFRQPVTMLGLGLAATLLLYALSRLYFAEAPARLVLMSCGIIMLVCGILLDRQDPNRTGIKHEWALWLFVLGSPLTIHPLFVGIIGEHADGLDFSGVAGQLFSGNEAAALSDAGLWNMILTVAGLAVLFIILGLLLDRRSLVASCMIYLSAVLSYGALRGGVDLSLTLAIVPLTIGLLVILLGVAWQPIRRVLLKLVPFRGLFRPAA